MLGLRRELADRHIFDHAPAQRAHGLVGHGDAPVLSEVVETPRSQDRTPRCAILSAVLPAAVPYRASGLVLWPISEVAPRLVEVRSGRHGGLDLLRVSSSHFGPLQTLPAWRPAINMMRADVRALASCI